MTTSTETLTFEKVIAEHAETLNYLLDQDDVTTLTPAEFIEALEDASIEFSDSFESTNQHNGTVFTAAAVLLTNALALPTDHPDTQVLLQRASAQLIDAEI
ncbi:hypothetical protein [Streptomyces sp. NPDC059783]|uniref:hypothetical protein n=1 Tax=Streptomyces sp. NPDC059783 TaxID=3346944 RepID=UPI00364BDAE1